MPAVTSEMASRPPKRRRIASTAADDTAPAKSNGKAQDAFFNKKAAAWNLEQDYESKARKGKKKQKKESQRLPIKTRDGVLQEMEDDDAASVVSGADWLDSENEEAADDGRKVVPEEPQISEREQILRAKEELAKIATKLNENPEENGGAFKALAQVGQTKVIPVQRLCLVTQLAVYKDVIPGYRIRPASEENAREQLSKEVRSLRSYEQALVSGYQAYLKQLAAFAKGSSTNGLADVAITCACALITSVPHFNFRGDLLKILVGKLSHRRIDASALKCRKALETMFRDDEEGRASLEAVSLLSKMIKAREYQVDETALNLFLHLRLLSEFSGKASQDDVEQPGLGGKKLKQKKEFRTKRQRKEMKEQKALDKDMANADALVSHEERDHLQSETLKLVFATYFRALKSKLPHLTGAVLEGLAKYSHLINQDFFGDLLEALKDLIRHADKEVDDDDTEEKEGEEANHEDLGVRNPSREALLCTVTAFALLAGQDAHNSRSNLHLDLSYFTTHLFRSLLALGVSPDLELGAKALHLPDPDDPMAAVNRGNKVNIQTTTVLLIRCLTAVLLPAWNIRSVPPLRLAAFSKQLMSVSLHMPEKSCQAALALLNDVSHAHAKKVSALWNTEERKGDGTFNALSETVEGSNPFATTVWEGEILRKHYCPKVREGVAMLEKSLRQS